MVADPAQDLAMLNGGQRHQRAKVRGVAAATRTAGPNGSMDMAEAAAALAPASATGTKNKRFGKAETETEMEVAEEVRRHVVAMSFLDSADDTGHSRTVQQRRE